MNKYFNLLLVIAAIVTIAANTVTRPEPHDEHHNLKVLPDSISGEQLDSVMDHFKVSLGVKCSFCHADGPVIDGRKHLDMASDSKPEKIRAREMLQMTAYLNATYFNPQHSARPDTIHAVICYTCHRGNEKPQASQLFLQVDSLLNLQHQRKK